VDRFFPTDFQQTGTLQEYGPKPKNTQAIAQQDNWKLLAVKILSKTTRKFTDAS
jgi:hypothetical protein